MPERKEGRVDEAPSLMEWESRQVKERVEPPEPSRSCAASAGLPGRKGERSTSMTRVL